MHEFSHCQLEMNEKFKVDYEKRRNLTEICINYGIQGD